MLTSRSEDVMAIASKLLMNVCLRSYALQTESLLILYVYIFQTEHLNGQHPRDGERQVHRGQQGRRGWEQQLLSDREVRQVRG
jgi:hypothetical protein